MWTEGESGKKTLRVQKCPDTCGRGLNSTHLFTESVVCTEKIKPRDIKLKFNVSVKTEPFEIKKYFTIWQ